MSNFQAPGKGQEGQENDRQGVRDGEDAYSILVEYFPQALSQSRSAFTKDHFDTYKGMSQLRELLRSGRITRAEYEAAKVELLFKK